MGEIVLTGKLLRWGNSFGIRISKADVEKLGVPPGTELSVRVASKAGRVDLSHLRFPALGENLSVDHDALLAETDAAEFPKPPRRRRMP